MPRARRPYHVEAMVAERLASDDLLEGLCEHGIEHLGEVRRAYVERSKLTAGARWRIPRLLLPTTFRSAPASAAGSSSDAEGPP